MTIGVGGLTQKEALSSLSNMTSGMKAIPSEEYRQRIKKAQKLMKEHQISAIYLNAGTNLYYFTGTRWYPSERLVGAILPAKGPIHYFSPHFEIDTLKGFMGIEGAISGWHEDESPYQLFHQVLNAIGITEGNIGIDESASFFILDGFNQSPHNYTWVNAKAITAGCRMQKSVNELALMQQAKDMTLEVHKAAAKILRVGISTAEVTDFIHQAHKKVGARGSSFCIVLFGQDTSYPHGVKSPKNLEQDDIVLIDTGCLVEGYNSDITRTYVFGKPSERQRTMWAIEKEAQLVAFAKAQPGTPCGQVDIAARTYLESKGLGPDYQVPGLPHRTGHGIGLDIHEWPYLVRSDETPLAPGMCFSNEPMLVLPNEFGVRLEDHFYMTENGPKWFTQPSHSIDDPFGYEA
ncbi:M24 family metallopeptidase [Aliikangiella sp. IMCC44359]|uniref:M24 family metallopeptidase n=1 Tax=Aliikangiella sp. IMCC44359 TaxID=3459125 RepID=UPI00403ABB02